MSELICVRCDRVILPGTNVKFVDDDFNPVDPEGLRIVVGGINAVHETCVTDQPPEVTP